MRAVAFEVRRCLIMQTRLRLGPSNALTMTNISRQHRRIAARVSSGWAYRAEGRTALDAAEGSE